MISQEEKAIRAIEAQKRLELMSVERGVQMYRAAERRAFERQGDAALVDTKPGMKLMSELIPNLEAAILARQKEGVAAMKKPGAVPKWTLPMLSLSPAKMALITVRTLLSSRTDKLTRNALIIGKRCQEEREFELFAEAERERVSEGILSSSEQELGMTKPRNIVSLMREYAGEVSERTFKSWRKKADKFESLGWTIEEREHLGVQLIFDTIESGGGWFEMRVVGENRPGKGVFTYRTVHLTEQAQDFINHHRELAEVNKPWLIPMIIKPRKWVKTETST